MKTKKQPNYSLKAKAISSGYCELQRQISHSEWEHSFALQYASEGVIEDTHEYLQSQHLKRKLVECDCELYQEAEKVNYASYKRRNRLQKRIESMLKNNNCVFLTLTFSDIVLDSTNEETRRKYVTRFLKDSSISYVANIDYGKENEREHYHAIVVADRVDMSKYDYGFIYAESIKKTSDSSKLAKYVVKLTNHAIKVTTKRAHTIYSKY